MKHQETHASVVQDATGPPLKLTTAKNELKVTKYK